jgi:hypothetical protein
MRDAVWLIVVLIARSFTIGDNSPDLNNQHQYSLLASLRLN